MKFYIPFMDKIAKAIDKREEKKELDLKPAFDEKKDDSLSSAAAPKKVEKIDSKVDIGQLSKSDSKKSLSKKNFFKYSYVS
jgi:hypothetical protein